MNIRELHDWQVTGDQARAIQHRLSTMISTRREFNMPQFIAGVDISRPDSQGIATGAAVVLSYPQLNVVEVKLVKQRINFPYIPGLLSFREAPLILAACRKLTTLPDIVMIDGQGIAHPKRLGLASHLGLLLDVSTIGCAKSRLCGIHGSVSEVSGSFTELRDKDGGEVIGAVLRTKNKVKPLYISIGHKIDLEAAIFWALECCRGYRLPEPTRLAHLAAAGHLDIKEEAQHSERSALKV